MSTFQLGRLTLQEPWIAGESFDRSHRVLTLEGESGSPPYEAAEITVHHDDILTLPRDVFIPLIFGEKSELNGLYEVLETSANLSNYFGDVITSRWNLTLRRWDQHDDVEAEARFTGEGRESDFAVTPERWHAPPIGSRGYLIGTSTPSTVSRTTEEGGDIVVRRSLTFERDSRYIVPLTDWYRGAVDLLVDGVARAGMRIDAAVTDVVLNNGLVKVEIASDGRLNVSAWNGTAWDAKSWDIEVDSARPTFQDVIVLHNTPEEVVLRLTSDDVAGRLHLDLSLKRGSRFVTGWIRRHASADLKVVRTTVEGGFAETGFLRASGDDVDGHRYVVGSAHTFTADTNGGISVANERDLDFFIGVALDGSAAQVGDQPADLFAQYLGTPSEHVSAVRR